MVSSSFLEHDVRWTVRIRGVVQGIGFRPHVARLAHQLSLSGFVRNTDEGVELEIEGPASSVPVLVELLKKDPHIGSKLGPMRIARSNPKGATEFRILPSTSENCPDVPMNPDWATCQECLAEVFDPSSRFHRYPFTSCTRCGPRFSILRRLPFDRENTCMAEFLLCRTCRSLYEDPFDRRFHAQTLACSECGPQLKLLRAQGERELLGDMALLEAARHIQRGAIVAVKGLGGFQLVVRADRQQAVTRLRRRKRRPDKPLAVMMSSLNEVRAIGSVGPTEARLLTSPENPIVLLKTRHGSSHGPLAPAVTQTPGLLGVLLPTTALHHLLAREVRVPLVCTSGNVSGEPLCTDVAQALNRLSDIADVFLDHNRPIQRAVDDYVTRVVDGEARLIRAARGYAPITLSDPQVLGATSGKARRMLAVGGHMKSAIALATAHSQVLSQHLGDLDTSQARDVFRKTVEEFQTLHGSVADHIVCDEHPDYASSQWATETKQSVSRVQHHHAHAVACMVERQIEGPALALCWDGTGLGSDGTIWGGELLRCDRKSFQRLAHLAPFRLPGGEAAIREPRRAALGLLHSCFGTAALSHDWTRHHFTEGELAVLSRTLEQGINSPLTSAAGRLFDGVAALLQLCTTATFEAQAALELELHALRSTEIPTPSVRDRAHRTQPVSTLEWKPLLLSALEGLRHGEDTCILSARFHRQLAELAIQATQSHQPARDPLPVLLTGGCFQNAILAESVSQGLRQLGYRSEMPARIPCNDGGLALGQLAIAQQRFSPESP